MTEPYALAVDPGRISGEAEDGAKPCWLVPLADSDKQERIAQALAMDVMLSGRWQSGKATEHDRRRLALDESHWRAECTCGLRMPCRHAQSLLFHFRAEAKLRPELWLQAAGADPARLKRRVFERRAQAVQTASRRNEAVEQRALARIAAQAEEAKDLEQMLTWRYPDPAFWNRDISLAAWLLPIMKAVAVQPAKEGGGEANDETEIDRALDSDVHPRP